MFIPYLCDYMIRHYWPDRSACIRSFLIPSRHCRPHDSVSHKLPAEQQYCHFDRQCNFALPICELSPGTPSSVSLTGNLASTYGVVFTSKCEAHFTTYVDVNKWLLFVTGFFSNLRKMKSVIC